MELLSLNQKQRSPRISESTCRAPRNDEEKSGKGEGKGEAVRREQSSGSAPAIDRCRRFIRRSNKRFIPKRCSRKAARSARQADALRAALPPRKQFPVPLPYRTVFVSSLRETKTTTYREVAEIFYYKISSILMLRSPMIICARAVAP